MLMAIFIKKRKQIHVKIYTKVIQLVYNTYIKLSRINPKKIEGSDKRGCWR